MKRMEGWGVTGWSNSWTALGSDEADDGPSQLSGYGVHRLVDPGVTYEAPPDVPDVPRWHEKPLGKGRAFEMEWREDSEPVTRSLLDIQQGLADRRRTLAADDPDLALLDAGVDGLVAAAAGLHAQKSMLGFVQPDSCRVGTLRDGKPFVVLPDVGFAWNKARGLMLPDWIEKPELPVLFEEGAVRHNEAYLAEIEAARAKESRDIRQQTADEAAREFTEVKIVVRLLAAALVGGDEVRRWCGTKKCLLALPSKDVAPDTQADIWDSVIAPALEGRIRTFTDLRARLAVCRPSSHYLHTPPTPPWGGWPIVRRVALATVAVGFLGVLLACSGPIIKVIGDWLIPPRAPYCRYVAKEDPLYTGLIKLKESHDVARGDMAERPAFWASLRECLGPHAEPSRCGRDCLAGLVDEWCRQADEEGLAVRERLRSRPRPTEDEVADISAAIVMIRQAEAEAKRPAASAVVPVLERELRRRGGSPPQKPAPSRSQGSD